MTNRSAWGSLPRSVRYPTLVVIVAFVLGTAGWALALGRYNARAEARKGEIAQNAQTFAASFDVLVQERLNVLQPIAAMPAMRRGDLPVIQSYLNLLDGQRLGLSGGVAWVDPQGNLTAQSGVAADRLPVSVADREWLRAVVDTGRPYVSAALPGPTMPGLFLILAVPVMDDTGHVAGVIAGGLGIGSAAAFPPLPADLLARAQVIDRAGQLIYDHGPVQSLVDVSGSPTFQAAQRAGGGLLDSAPGVTGNGDQIVGFAPAPVGGLTVLDEERPGAVLSGPRTEFQLELIALIAVALTALGGVILLGRRLDKEAHRRADAEAEIGRAERRFHAFADRIPVLAWLMTPAGTGKAAFANAFYREYFGPKPQPGIGATTHPDDTPELAAMAEVVLARGVGQCQVRLRRHDGSFRWHLIRAESLPERVDGVVVAAVDVDELWYALHAKDELLSLVSHELRTPLTQILGNASFLQRRRPLPPEVEAESINEILQQSQRLQMLIENMLMLSRLERGMTSEPAEPQLLQRVVPGMVKAFCEQHRDVLVELSLAPNLPPVEVEQATIDQVLSNLLTNAAKYGPPGRPIRVEASQVGADVRVAVQDEGTSVPPEELPRLFDPFYRTESAASRGDGGLGLGLSVCKRLVERANGFMYATRCPGGGMEFGFHLRVATMGEGTEPNEDGARSHPANRAESSAEN